MIELFYNFLSFIIIFSFIVGIGLYFRKIANTFKKDFLGDIIILVFLTFGVFSVCYIGKKAIYQVNAEVYEKLGMPEYRLLIHPKNYPFEREIKVCFDNKDTGKSITIILDTQNYDSEEIYQKIKPDADSIKMLLKYP